MRLVSVLTYLAVEIGVFVALCLTLGFGWAVLINLAAALAGFVMLRRQGAKVVGELRRASRNETAPGGALADGALVAVATVLLVIPGVVATVLGIILLAPPARRALRPVVTAFGARTIVTLVERNGLSATGTYPRADVIDGTVVERSDGTTHLADETRWSATPPQLPRGH
ncbi:MAG: FxsA family protein [Gordonia sp. (in: high G+C Gram-positive bacteria)]